MKTWILMIGFIFTVSCSSKPTATSNANDGSIQFKLQDYKTETLSNGLKIVTIENHELPSIGFGMLVKTGSSYDPMAKTGLMSLTALVMEKGTKNRTATEIADQLGNLGSDFQQSVTEDFSWFQLTGLSFHQETLLDIFQDILLAPAFSEAEINREKQNVLASIKKLVDYPDRFASEAFDSFLFGGHPYSRPVIGIARDVQIIRRNDLLRAYKQVFQPQNAILVVTGDIKPEMRAKLIKTFAIWKGTEQPKSIWTKPPSFKGLQLRLVQKDDLTQSQVLFGQVAIKRDDPDFMKLRVANTILGGNLSSRLMDEIRVNKGYTYGINSQVDARLDRGPFVIGTSTRNETAGPLINETLRVVRNFVEKGVTQAELDASRNYLLGMFPKAIETPQKLGFNLAVLDFYNLGDDYLKNFAKNLESITLDDLNATIKKHLSPSDFKILVLGPKTVLNSLREIGPVEVRTPSQIF